MHVWRMLLRQMPCVNLLLHGHLHAAQLVMLKRHACLLLCPACRLARLLLWRPPDVRQDGSAGQTQPYRAHALLCHVRPLVLSFPYHASSTSHATPAPAPMQAAASLRPACSIFSLQPATHPPSCWNAVFHAHQDGHAVVEGRRQQGHPRPGRCGRKHAWRQALSGLAYGSRPARRELLSTARVLYIY